MKRRLVLLIGSFVAIAAACGIYAMVVGSGAGGERAGRARPPQATRTVRGPAVEGGPQALEGEYPRLVDRDDQGRLKWVLTGTDSHRQEDGTYVLSSPKAVLYQRNGQTVQITADEGFVFIDSPRGGGGDLLRSDQGTTRLKVKHGSLKGNVKLYYDRSTDPQRPPVEQREGQPEVMTVRAEDIYFDNERLMLHTDNRVTVQSQEIELSGRGLSLRWNEDPQELRVLRLEQGDQLVIRYPKSQEGGFAGITVQPEPAAPAEAGGVAVQPSAAAVERPSPATAAAPATWEQILTGGWPSVQAVAPRGKAQNRQRAVFSGNVVVRQGQRYLRGADELAIEFEWAPPGSSQATEQGVEGKLPQANKRPQEVARVEDAAMVAPADGELPPPPATQPAATHPAPQQEVEAVTVTWTGALEITPCGYTEKSSRRNIAVSGRGREKVELSDGQTTADCREFSFSRQAGDGGDWQRGRLDGEPNAPASLETTAGEEVVCASMLFGLTPRGDAAALRGPGYVIRPTEKEAAVGRLPGARAAAAEAAAPSAGVTSAPVASTDRVSWTQGVDVRLARQSSEANAGQGGLYVAEAVLRGQVELARAGQSDQLTCGNLRVYLGSEGGRQYLQRALADGKVLGRQAEQQIAADSLDVAFDHYADPSGKAHTDVDTVLAEGSVSVSGGGGDRRWTAGAERLQADASAGTAVLIGSPARLQQTDGTLTAGTIHFQAFQDQRGSLIRGAGLAWVDGGGTLNMMMNNDLSGRKLATPRPAEITWSDEMRYVDWKSDTGLVPQAPPDAPAAIATFTGQVHLASGGDEMTCGRMQAAFQESARPSTPPAARAAASAGERRGRVVDMGSVGYGGNLSIVHATDSVILRSRRYDDEGHVLGWAELHTGRMTYDANAKTMDSEKGWLLVQDLRPPKERPWQRPGESADELPTGDIESPSQTYFEWAQSMRLVMKERMVQLAGDVWMRHRSADKIVEQASLRRDWNIPAWPDKLPSGRATDLRCDDLLARFAAPEESARPSAPPAGSAGEEDMQAGLNVIGPLDVFLATGAVLLKDDPWEVVGQRLRYDRTVDLVSIYGFLEGQPQADARITRKGAGTNTSPWIRWYRQNARLARMQDRVETGPTTGSGVVQPSSRRGRR